MIMLLIAFLVRATVERKPLDPAKLNLGEAIAVCDFANGNKELMFLARDGDKGYLSFSGKGLQQLRAPIVRATDVLKKSSSGEVKELEVIAKHSDGRSATMLMNYDRRPMETTLILSKNKKLSGTCKFVPNIPPASTDK